MQEELYGKTLYACFVNDKGMDENSPQYYHNEYELVSAGVIDPFLKRDKELFAPEVQHGWFAGEEIFYKTFREFMECGVDKPPFQRNKLTFTGRQQIYYADVLIEGYRTARKLGSYRRWYKLTFSKEGAFCCSVRDYSSPTEEFFYEMKYQCDIETLSKEENEFLLELYRVYPDGEHLHEGKKGENFKDGPVGTLFVGAPVHSVRINHCPSPYYLFVEFLNAAYLPVGIFDMGYQAFAVQNYGDQLAATVGGWPGRIPMTVLISHFHDDHINGLLHMVNIHNHHLAHGGGDSYNYFFGNIDIHIPDTFQPPSYDTITATLAAAGGNVQIYDDQQPFGAPNAAFDYGLINFNHPVDNMYFPHPHLHGMYARCTTTLGTRVLIAGDSVYRGMGAPAAGDLAGPYDQLVACHHGGDYAVSIAGWNLPPGTLGRHYIPISAGGEARVIYSSNGNGHGHHPAPWAMQDHINQGWTASVITNNQNEVIL